MTINEQAKEIIYKDFKDKLKQPASLSGIFHRGETMEEHLIRCVNIMEYLCDAFNIHGEDREVLIAAMWLHDIGKLILATKKKIKNKFWVNHPTGWSRIDCLMQIHSIISSIILDNYKIGRKRDIKRLVSIHMGHWYKNECLPRPQNLHEYLIVLADYLASRKGGLFKYERR